MKGLTRLEVDVLLMAKSSLRHQHIAESDMTNTVLQLLRRRLLELQVMEDLGNGMRLAEGVITPLGNLVLSVVLTEPSLIVS